MGIPVVPIRHFDASSLNLVVNDPAVRPFIDERLDGPLDFSAGVANRNNVLLMGEHGGTFFIRLLPGIYEVHTFALPAGRGKWIAAFVRATAEWMFTKTEAFEITTRIPCDHVAARRLALTTGMKFEFSRPNECRWQGKLQDVDVHSFRIQDWAPTACQLDAKGRDFHEFLHEEAKRLGITTPPHGDDPNHNRYVGIALAMVDGGQALKAVSFYNRWALSCRHPTIALMSTNPITVRFDIGNLIFENGTKRVEKLDMAA